MIQRSVDVGYPGMHKATQQGCETQCDDHTDRRNGEHVDEDGKKRNPVEVKNGERKRAYLCGQGDEEERQDASSQGVCREGVLHLLDAGDGPEFLVEIDDG